MGQDFNEAILMALNVSELLEPASMKPLQLEGLQHFFNRKDTVILLPTGYGKSLIFQLTPFLFTAKQQHLSHISQVKNITLVISPLNAIMKDQVHSLCNKGIPACYLDMNMHDSKTFVLKSDISVGDDSDSDNDEDELMQVSTTLEAIRKGAYPLVYTHPEALLSTKRGKILLRNISSRICCVAIDEAHMISEWWVKFIKCLQ